MDGYNSLIDSISRPSPHPDDSESALRSTYRWVEAFISQKHYAPTIFEIATGLSIKYDAARNRLLKMEQRRWIGRDGRIRSIVLRGIPEESTEVVSPQGGLPKADSQMSDKSKRDFLSDYWLLTTPHLSSLDYNALASLADHLAVAMAGHERAAELFALFGETYHVKRKEIEMEAAYVEAERIGD